MRQLEFTESTTAELIYDILVGFLSVVAMLVLVLQFYSELTPHQEIIIEKADNIIYFLFVAEGGIRLILSKNKLSYLKNNKWDYIALIPLQFLIHSDFGSILKVLRVITYGLRLIDNTQDFIKSTGFIPILVTTIGITVLGSIALYYFEYGTDAISSYSDALWLSIVTLTTVGYGDISPVTGAGKLIAVILMLSGIGFLSLFTSTISSYFISLKRKQELEDLKERKNLDISNLTPEKQDQLILFYDFLSRED